MCGIWNPPRDYPGFPFELPFAFSFTRRKFPNKKALIFLSVASTYSFTLQETLSWGGGFTNFLDLSNIELNPTTWTLYKKALISSSVIVKHRSRSSFNLKPSNRHYIKSNGGGEKLRCNKTTGLAMWPCTSLEFTAVFHTLKFTSVTNSLEVEKCKNDVNPLNNFDSNYRQWLHDDKFIRLACDLVQFLLMNPLKLLEIHGARVLLKPCHTCTFNVLSTGSLHDTSKYYRVRKPHTIFCLYGFCRMPEVPYYKFKPYQYRNEAKLMRLLFFVLSIIVE